MSLNLSNKIVTNGLIFYIDQANFRKSWRGPLTTNLITYSNNFTNAVWVNYQATVTANTSETVSPDGRYVAYKLAASTSGGTYSFINYGYSSGTTSTFSIFAKAGEYGRIGISNRSSNTFGAIFDLVNGTVVNTWNGTGTITSTGISSIGGGWYRVWVTSAATNQYNVHPLPDAESTASNLNNVSTLVAGYGVYIAGAQLEAYSFPTPLVSTNGATASRSNTQSVVDLINAGNTVTVNNLTYTAAGSPSGTYTFNGSTSYMTTPMTNLRPGNGITQEVWFNLASTAGDQVFIGSQYGTSSGNSYALWGNGNLWFGGVNTTGSFSYLTATATKNAGTWYHYVYTYNGNVEKLYINGAEVASGARTGSIVYDTNNTQLAIGGDWNGAGYDAGMSVTVNGQMPVVKLYNRGLPANEVQQNFNALRSRYGI